MPAGNEPETIALPVFRDAQHHQNQGVVREQVATTVSLGRPHRKVEPVL